MSEQESSIREGVKDYYGKQVQSTKDLKSNVCCAYKSPPQHIRQILSTIHAEVLDKFYGCGLVCPPAVEGLTVLDLGCGSGRDCYLLSALVGSQGKVIGVDMTDEQLAVAIKHIDYHTKQFGYTTPNVEFKKGYIEQLGDVGIGDNSVDLIVSNCVINLSVDKESVLRECYRALKAGGEMYFSDVYSDRRVPAELKKDPVLYGECLSGALYWNDFKTLARKVGFCDPLLVETSDITVDDSALQAKLGPIKFFSRTYRLLKVPDQEPSCEDYGQSVRYKGGIEHSPDQFVLDITHVFPKGQDVRVCGNTFSQLQHSRYGRYFDFMGDRSCHHGLFSCDLPVINQANSAALASSACCTGKKCC